MSEIVTSDELNRVYNLFRHGATLTVLDGVISIDISETPYSKYSHEEINSSGFREVMLKGVIDLFHQCEIYDTDNIRISEVRI